jgi:hypothetical protein
MAEGETRWWFQIGPRIWRASARRESGEWAVTAEWVGASGRSIMPRGPSKVTVALAKGAPKAARVRGITAAALRSVEAELTQMSREFLDRPELGQVAEPLEAVLEQARRLPDSPRAIPNYYARLLRTFHDLEELGHPEPLNALAEAMSVPKNTVKSRLRLAREWARRRDAERLGESR